MYVDPFWMGVIVTFVTEILACILYAAINGKKGKHS